MTAETVASILYAGYLYDIIIIMINWDVHGDNTDDFHGGKKSKIYFSFFFYSPYAFFPQSDVTRFSNNTNRVRHPFATNYFVRRQNDV